MNEEEKKAIEKFIEKCNKYDESVEIKGVSVGEENRILTTVCKALNHIEKLQKENEDITQQRDYYKARYNALSKIVDLMAKHIYSLGYYDCLYEECDDNMDRECEDCIKEYFYKKVKETKDNGSTRNI
uniref:Uncharacterized protein n=1 Tax=Myoviridae sp. ct2Pw37 TaxID=2825021 RepID=A0A8S5PAU5_9CAUD|nr:MAG TPA: hypothetical protein [Myoviridae sp. ct2Pw37]